jgi:hypothetical protein
MALSPLYWTLCLKLVEGTSNLHLLKDSTNEKDKTFDFALYWSRPTRGWFLKLFNKVCQ